jgi:hypothetical protein
MAADFGQTGRQLVNGEWRLRVLGTSRDHPSQILFLMTIDSQAEPIQINHPPRTEHPQFDRGTGLRSVPDASSLEGTTKSGAKLGGPVSPTSLRLIFANRASAYRGAQIIGWPRVRLRPRAPLPDREAVLAFRAGDDPHGPHVS